MGIVYKARQPGLDRFVALKILSPELSKDPAFSERFSREAKALARLNHPNIVGVYDFGKAGDLFYFAMEYVDGMNLWQLEQSKKKLSPEEAFTIIPRICDALQYAHDEGVVHRDIKPGNILIDKKGRVKIADFGLAKLLGKEQQPFGITQTRVTMGTPHYMAPEQIEKPLDVDHRADIYSLGVVFYEMLTGELPIGRFAAPSERVQIDVRLDEVVLRALEKEPARRYQQVSEVRTQVDKIAGSPGQATTSTVKSAGQQTPSAPSSTDKARGWFFKSASGCLIAIGLFVIVAIVAILFAIALPAMKHRKVNVHINVEPTMLTMQEFNWETLQSEGRLLGGVTTTTNGRTVLKIENTNDSPLQLTLLKIDHPSITGTTYALTGEIAYDNVQGNAFLELWNVFPPTQPDAAEQQYFSRTLGEIGSGPMARISGTSHWRELALPFNRTGIDATPTRLKLNIILPGHGTVYLSGVKLVQETSSSNASTANPIFPELTASQIVERTISKYKSLKSFRAKGVETTEMRYTDKPDEIHTLTSEFSLNFARPNLCRIETKSNSGENGGVWSDGEEFFSHEYAQISRQKDFESAMKNSYNVNKTASDLFFSNGSSWLPVVQIETRLPDDTVEGDKCYVVSGLWVGHKMTLWITKKDFLLKQRQYDLAYVTPKVVAPAPVLPTAMVPQPPVPSPGPEDLRRIPTRTLKIAPTAPPSEFALPSIPTRSLRLNPVLPPAPMVYDPRSPSVVASSIAEETKKRMAEVQERAKTIFGTKTEIYRDMAANQPTKKEDFEYVSAEAVSNDPAVRMKRAEELVQLGKYPKALKEFLWCWDLGENENGFAGSRITALLSDISGLGKKYPPALEALKTRRDQLDKVVSAGKLEEHTATDLGFLNGALGQSERTLELFDKLPPASSDRNELITWFMELFLEHKRYDVVLDAIPDPELKFEEVKKSFSWMHRPPTTGMSPEVEKMIAESNKRMEDSNKKYISGKGAIYLEILAGSKKTERAKKLADKVLENDNSPETVSLLKKRAVRAENKELIEYLEKK
ncbi:MAG: pknB [Verrucomicrobiales bacterium]|nr:pknB [Verrucomicrobiales bacterium]